MITRDWLKPSQLRFLSARIDLRAQLMMRLNDLQTSTYVIDAITTLSQGYYETKIENIHPTLGAQLKQLVATELQRQIMEIETELTSHGVKWE